MDAFEQKMAAIISALKGEKYPTNQKQSFAKAIVDGLTDRIDFAISPSARVSASVSARS